MLRGLLASLLVVGACLRLAPSLITGEPFSTDSWPLIAESARLGLGLYRGFWGEGGLNSYSSTWPSVIAASVFLGHLTGLGAYASYLWLLSPALSLALGIAGYSLLRALAPRGPGALAGLAVLLFTPSLLVFTSAPLKEVYSLPIMYSLMLAAWSSRLRPAYLVLVALLSGGLVMSHPLTPLLAAAFILSYTALGYKGGWGSPRGLAAATITLALLGLHYYYRGRAEIAYRPSPGDLEALALYGLLVYGAARALRAFGAPYRPLSYAGVLAVWALSLAAIYAPIVPGIEVYSGFIVVYALGLLAPLSLLAIRGSPASGSVYAALLTALLYIILYKQALFWGVHRLVNHATLAGSMLVASQRGRAPFTAALVTGLAGLAVAIALALGYDGVSFYWVYREPEVEGFRFLAEASVLALWGDAKVGYYVSSIVNRGVNTPPLESPGEGSLAIVYRDNLRHGYATLGHGVVKLGGLPAGLHRVYDNWWVAGLVGG